MRIKDALIALPIAMAIVTPASAIQYMNVAQAQKAIFPDADRFVQTNISLSPQMKNEIKKRSGVAQRWDAQEVWRAEKSGKLLGFFIVDAVIGKHEFITYGAGLTIDGRVRGVEIIIYNETRGDQIRDIRWRNTLVGKSLRDAFVLDKDVPNISGATLSCKNVMMGVKRLLTLQSIALPRA
jgi:Na+-translocating ferredoxin:NAD+ oxidoreductase RnfG subunit